jgi:hypothetical protein
VSAAPTDDQPCGWRRVEPGPVFPLAGQSAARHSPRARGVLDCEDWLGPQLSGYQADSRIRRLSTTAKSTSYWRDRSPAAGISGLALSSLETTAVAITGVLAILAALGWTLRSDDRARRLALLIRALRNTTNRPR